MIDTVTEAGKMPRVEKKQPEPAKTSHNNREPGLAEVGKAVIRLFDRDKVHESSEGAYQNLQDIVNIGRPESRKITVTRTQHRVEDDLTSLEDRLPYELSSLAEQGDLGSFTELSPGATDELILLIGGVSGDDTICSDPIRDENSVTTAKDAPKPNGLVVNLLRGYKDTKAHGPTVLTYQWPNSMSLEQQGPQKVALALLSYSEKVAKLRKSGKLKKAQLMGTSTGGSAITAGLDVLAQQGLLPTFIDNLGPDGKIIISQSPMHLDGGVDRIKFLMGKILTEKGAESLFYGIKAMLGLDKQMRREHFRDIVKAGFTGDFTYLYNQLRNAQTISPDTSSPSLAGYLEAKDTSQNIINVISRSPFISELKAKIDHVVDAGFEFIQNTDMMRTNTVNFLERLRFLDQIDFRSPSSALNNERTIDSFLRNNTQIHLLYGSQDGTILPGQIDAAAIHFQPLGEFVYKKKVNNFSHNGWGDSSKAQAVLKFIDQKPAPNSHSHEITL